MNENEIPRIPVPRAESAPAEREVMLKLPGSLGSLSADQQKKFDDLLWPSVIPWTGKGYRLGLNGLFTFVPGDVVAGIEDYLDAPVDSDAYMNARPKLREKLRAIWAEQFDRIHQNLSNWDEEWAKAA